MLSNNELAHAIEKVVQDAYTNHYLYDPNKEIVRVDINNNFISLTWESFTYFMFMHSYCLENLRNNLPFDEEYLLEHRLLNAPDETFRDGLKGERNE